MRLVEEPGPPLARVVVVRPIGHPLPLGLMAFSTATVLTSASALGWLAGDPAALLAVILLVFAAPLEALAAVLAYLARDAVSATSLAIFAGVWTVTGVAGLVPVWRGATTVLGVFFLLAATWLLLLAAAASAGRPLLAVGLVVAAASYALSGFSELRFPTELSTAAGATGIAVAAAAAYVALALLLEDAHRRPVLPVLRLGRARLAAEGDLADQFETVHAEAGVREQL